MMVVVDVVVMVDLVMVMVDVVMVVVDVVVMVDVVVVVVDVGVFARRPSWIWKSHTNSLILLMNKNRECMGAAAINLLDYSGDQ